MGRGLGLLLESVLAVGKDKGQAGRARLPPDASELEGTWEGDELTGFPGQDGACARGCICVWLRVRVCEGICKHARVICECQCDRSHVRV